MPITMTLEEFIGRDEIPPPDVLAGGIETDWLWSCELHVPTGRLWAGDACGLEADVGLVMNVSPGTYLIEARGVEFSGARFVSRVRVRPPSGVVDLGPELGPTGTDSCAIGFADIGAVEAGTRLEGDRVWSRLGREVCAQCGIVRLANGATVPYVGAGLWNGSARVHALRAAGRVVGMDVEILMPPGAEVVRFDT